MIRYLRIRYKFFIMAALGVIAIVLMSLLAQRISEDGLFRLRAVFKDSQAVQIIQQELISPLFKIRETTLSLVMAPNEDFRSQIRKDLSPMIDRLDKAFNQTDNKSLIIMWNNYKRLVFITDNYIKKGFEEGAFTNANSAERKQFYALMNSLEALQNSQLKNSSFTFQKAEQNFVDKQRLIVAGAISVIILTLIFGYLIARNIVFSIDRVQLGLTKFFDLLGRKIDKDEKIKIELDNKDELGQMAHIINKNVEIVRESLKSDIKLIEEATLVVKSLKKGGLDKRLTQPTRTDELNKLKFVMNDVLDQLEDRIVAEIQERTKQEQLLIQQSKLASMGNMIGNIAHQWRQPLSELNAVLMNMEVKREHGDLNDEVFQSSIEECDALLEHMSKTISDFQNFFKPSKEQSYFSLQEACKNAAFIIESSLKYNNIKFAMDIDKDISVLGYPREFAQAILNLLSNAKDVLTERRVQDPKIDLNLLKGNRYALIKIQDNGGGIEPSMIDRIFEPYFTTKHAKRGTGIGLYMSKIIIEENMHGIIKVENISQGACFTIKLGLRQD